MVDHCIDDAITDRLSDDELRISDRVEVQLLADVRKVDARIGKVDLAQTSLDDIVTKTVGREQLEKLVLFFFSSFLFCFVSPLQHVPNDQRKGFVLLERISLSG